MVKGMDYGYDEFGKIEFTSSGEQKIEDYKQN
jgi:hypothetical protein